MKMFRNISSWNIVVSILAICSFAMSSCTSEERAIGEVVDLRFRAESNYTLDHTDPEVFEIIVQSTEPWIVYCDNPDWCTIEPSSGVADERVTVTVTYHNNEELDDRSDVVYVESDGWIGTEIDVFQKGTAYLTTLSTTESLEMEADSGSVAIETNQKWSAQVTVGEDWLSITDGSTGEGDGSVSFQAPENKGEIRVGEITLYDRYNAESSTITVAQNGVVLQTTSNEYEYRVFFDTATVTIPITSNGDWTVVKDNEFATWYSFVQESFSGDGDIVINLSQNSSTSTLITSFSIMSVSSDESVTPVVKNIALKQGNEKIVERREFGETEQGNWYTFNEESGYYYDYDNEDIIFKGTDASRVWDNSIPLGLYNFKIKSMSATAIAKVWVNHGSKSVCMMMDTDGFGLWASGADYVADTAVENFMGENVIGIDVYSDDDGVLSYDCYLNYELIHSYSQYSSSSDSTSLPYMIFGSVTNTTTFDWYEYTAPIDWN